MFRLQWLRKMAKVRRVAELIALSAAFVVSGAASLYGQSFTLSASAFNNYAIDQGGSTVSTVTLTPVNGFSGTVDLTCAVTGTVTNNPPVCGLSPTSVSPPGTASLTFTGLTSGGASATPGSYVVTVTGTGTGCAGGSSCVEQQALNISVLAVAPSFTVTVQRPMQPNAVHAGAGATALININPINSYTGSVWLSCATISPLVPEYPPFCSFSPQPATVNGVQQVTLTVQTLGNAQKAGNVVPRNRFFAMWLPLPLLAFAGIGAAGSKRSRKAWALLAGFILAGSLLLVPGCGNTTTGTTAPTPTNPTPKNTYTFTLMGVDSNGNLSTNTGAAAPTVTLTVN